MKSVRVPRFIDGPEEVDPSEYAAVAAALERRHPDWAPYDLLKGVLEVIGQQARMPRHPLN